MVRTGSVEIPFGPAQLERAAAYARTVVRVLKNGEYRLGDVAALVLGAAGGAYSATPPAALPPDGRAR